ncbi:MAG: Uma2 family endonuclease [Cytophagales bacterium]
MLLKEEKVISTIEEYEFLPEGAKYQFIDQEIIEMPSPFTRHQKIIGKLFFIITSYAIKNNLGDIFVAPLDVELNKNNIFQPDIFFISTKNKDIITDKRIVGSPDLVFEVLSEGTAYLDYKKKKSVYEAEGVKEYWIVDPESQTIEIFVNTPEKEFQLFSVYKRGKLLQSTIFIDLVFEFDSVFG